MQLSFIFTLNTSASAVHLTVYHSPKLVIKLKLTVK